MNLMTKNIVLAACAAFTIGCGSVQESPSNNSTAVNNTASQTEKPSGEAGRAPSPTPSLSPSVPETNKVVQVRFPTGATEASYTDSFAGYAYVDYNFDARADQNLTAEITQSDGDKAIMTVMRNGDPIESDASMVQGWTGILPENGRYTIRVGQMRNDARTGDEAVKFSLTIRIVD
jgi:hypothetical protein